MMQVTVTPFRFVNYGELVRSKPESKLVNLAFPIHSWLPVRTIHRTRSRSRDDPPRYGGPSCMGWVPPLCAEAFLPADH